MNIPTVIPTKTPGIGYVPEYDSYLLQLNDISDVYKLEQVFPNLYTTQYNTSYLSFIPMHIDSIRILANMGVETQGIEPFHFHYTPNLLEGEYVPMQHQLIAAGFHTVNPRSYNFSSMRTGKTGTITYALDYVQQYVLQGIALIACTKSTMRDVWAYTLEKTLPHANVTVLHAEGKGQRKKLLKTNADYLVINFDGIKILERELLDLVRNGVIRKIVFDELTHYGNPKSGRSKSAYKLANGPRPVDYCWGLTGTPAGDLEKIFGFMHLINPSKLPCRRKDQWKNMVMYQYAPWKWAEKPEAKAIINSVLQPAIRFDKKDIMDLPPVMYSKRTCELTSEQQHVYQQLVSQSTALVKGSEKITAQQKSAIVHKIFQLSAGAVYNDDGGITYLENTPRIDLLVDIINETDRKVVIFCAYTGVILHLAEQLKKRKAIRNGQERLITVEVIYGATSEKQRREVRRKFQENAAPLVVICHVQPVAYGTEFSAADTIIFNGPPISGECAFEQAVERVSSIRQTSDKISIVYVSGTAEERVFFKALDNKMSFSEAVNETFLHLNDR